MSQAELSFGTNDRGHRAAVLRLLQDGQPHDTLELLAVGGTRAPARVFELRRAGWDITCSGERGRYRYQLVGRKPVHEQFPELSWRRRALIAEARVRELEAQLGDAQ